MNSGIYQIISLINGKIYIGSAINFNNRFSEHIRKLNKNIHENKHLQRSWNKYGQNNFDFEILQIIQSKKDLINCEQFWIDKTECTNRKHGYNIYYNAKSPLGYRHTEEAKKKISIYSMNRKISEETRNKMSLKQKGDGNSFYGKHHTIEHNNKISLCNSGENNGNCKLNYMKVRIIRAFQQLKNKPTNEEIADFFDVSKVLIGLIVNNKIWRMRTVEQRNKNE